MFLYTIKKDQLKKISLPEKVYGSYSLVDENDHFLVNVEAINGKWHLIKNKNIELLENQAIIEDAIIEPFTVYGVRNRSNDAVYQIIATPVYDQAMQRYTIKSNTITIGSSLNDTICFPYELVKEQHITLTKNNNYWIATSNEGYAFVCDKGLKQRNIFYGDYIFLYGLKIILLGEYIIVNNPHGLVRIKEDIIVKENYVKQEPVYEAEIEEDTPQYKKEDYFFKAPHFKSFIECVDINITPPPTKRDRSDLPTIIQYGPQITMILLSLIGSGSSIYKFFSGMATLKESLPTFITIGSMLLIAILWPAITRGYAKRKQKSDEKRRINKYLKYLDSKEQKINEIKSLQKQILIENNISLEECQAIIFNRKRNLWERNINSEEFLSVRLGIGEVDCQIKINDIKEEIENDETDEVRERYLKLVKNAKRIQDCPMDLNILKKHHVAMVGNNANTKYFMDSIFLQILTFHSYRDLKIVTFTNEKNAYLWEYLKIAPHSWNEEKNVRFFADSLDEANELSTYLEQEFTKRVTKNNSAEPNYKEDLYLEYRPYYLIFIDDLEMVRNLGIIRRVLNAPGNIGFSIVVRNDRLSNLPGELKTFINVDPKLSGLFESDLIVDNQKQFVPEFNHSIDMYSCAQKLANIPIIKGKTKYELPKSISFLNMYKVGKVSQLNSLDRWQNNNPVTSLSVPVGINQDGELFKMDAHEKAFGPHGLVAGMTGSGKSEWLITYILSLAVNFHPDEVQFVLIDYKGGGLALSFENQELGIKLPHLAGLITNLDKSSISRALTSIEAELKRRQKVFNEAREKLHESSINIYKYQQYYRKGMVDEPMSHLFIISDEFAELKSQEPEFLDQLVSTARIGRSLGVHLILATQKPSGVVNDQIWSNARFKVCLRVQDKSDSQELIKCPDAAYLKTTGSFYLQVGYNEFFALGQSAWSGAKYYPSDVIKKDIDQNIDYIDTTGRVINAYDNSVLINDKVEIPNQGEELLNIVSYISNIATQTKVVGRKLWLDNIPTTIMLNDIEKRYPYQPDPYDITTIIGEYDNPALQLQDVYKINLAENTVIYGETGSGKENLIATMMWSSIGSHTPKELNYYVIDFGAETLRMFNKYPHVGEIAFQDNVDLVAGILDLVNEEISKRKELFADYNGNYDSYIKESGKTLARWVIVINAWDIFQETLPRIVDIVSNMFRDATKYGISFIISVSTNALRTKTASFFKNKIVLHQPSDDMYRMILGCPKNLIPAKALSRGIANVEDNLYCEFQGALICEQDNINSFIRKNGDKLAAYYKTSAKKLTHVPNDVTSSELVKYITDLNNVPVGYSVNEKNITSINLQTKIYPICVDDLKSNIKSINGLINVLTNVPGNKVRIIDFAHLYNGNNIDIKAYNDNLDAVCLAFKNDAETRNTNKDHAINIILGAGLFKTKLKSIGLEAFNDMMSNIDDAPNTSIILIDNYERMKELETEPWFNQIDLKSGMFIGKGILKQDLLCINKINSNDCKLEFEGIGYVIDQSDYTIIKTVMDGED